MDHHYHQYVEFGLKREDNIDSNDRKGDENNNNLDLKRGSWTVEEDFTLMNHIALHGEGRWNSLARSAGNILFSIRKHYKLFFFFLINLYITTSSIFMNFP